MTTIQPAQSWISQVGVAWALDDAPCPHDLLATLIAIARRADAQGKGSWQSAATISAKVGKSVRQIREDIKRLRSANLIILGDQSIIPPEIPTGRRPVVYDLVLASKGAKPIRQARNPSGKNKCTLPMDSAGATGSTGAIESTSWSAMESASRGDAGSTQKRLLEKEVKETLSAPEAASSSDREKDLSDKQTKLTVAHQELAKLGVHANLADQIIARQPSKGPGWWRHLGRNGDLASLIAEVGPQQERRISSNRARCQRHIGELAHNCRACRSEMIAATDNPPIPAMAAADAIAAARAGIRTGGKRLAEQLTVKGTAA